MPRGLEVSLPEELQPAVLEPAMVVEWLAREEGRDLEDELTEEEEKYIVDNAATLRLEFMKIVRIDNLARLKNLTRLFLDNNFIEAISGLESLTNLEWLDLSFNKISKIENLERLTKLKVRPTSQPFPAPLRCWPSLVTRWSRWRTWRNCRSWR